MAEPIQITEHDLFAKIGRQAVEIDILRARLAETQADEPPEPPPEPSP